MQEKSITFVKALPVRPPAVKKYNLIQSKVHGVVEEITLQIFFYLFLDFYVETKTKPFFGSNIKLELIFLELKIMESLHDEFRKKVNKPPMRRSFSSNSSLI